MVWPEFDVKEGKGEGAGLWPGQPGQQQGGGC